MSLQHTDLMDLLNDDNVNVSDEVTVFETIVAWIQHESNTRKWFCQELLETVRFELIDNDVIDGLVTSLECMNNGALLSQFVMSGVGQCGSGVVSVRETNGDEGDGKKNMRIGNDLGSYLYNINLSKCHWIVYLIFVRHLFE